jgi:SAM-dependent methyltransferase
MSADSRTSSYQESERFIELLRRQFVEIGMDTHPQADVRQAHHVLGVHRVLDLLPYLEPYLNCPLTDARILDLGCATGSASLAFAWRHCRQVVGLDITWDPLGLKLARQRTQVQKLAVDFTQGDGCRLPYASNTFDFCFCEWVIEHIPTPLTLLRELGRVLVPGGVLYISTNNRLWPYETHSGLWMISWLPQTWMGKLATWLGRCSATESWDVWLLTHRQLLSLARRAGLDIIGTRKDIFPTANKSSLGCFEFLMDNFAPNLYLLVQKL